MSQRSRKLVTSRKLYSRKVTRLIKQRETIEERRKYHEALGKLYRQEVEDTERFLKFVAKIKIEDNN